MQYSTLTQADINDGPFTEYNEGYVAYLFGHYLYENPYTDRDEHDASYCLWYDGWNQSQKDRPHLESKEE